MPELINRGTRSQHQADPATGSIKIKYATTEDEPSLAYTCMDFTFEQGKIIGWTGKIGPVQKALWTRTTADSKPGTKAKLESAYRSNNGNLFVVVELAASKGRGSVTLSTGPRADTGKAVLNRV